jgi:AraC-like DNA-binding protein
MSSVAIESAAPSWTGSLELGPGWALFEGRAGDCRPHRHPAIQLCLGQGAPVRVELEDGLVEAPGVLIGADLPHALGPGPVRLLLVERHCSAGRRLDASATQRLRRLGHGECRELEALWRTADAPAARLLALVERLAGPASPAGDRPGARSRMRALIEALPALPPHLWHTDALAQRLHLSPSRFAHAFREAAQMAVRPYLRWMRLARALQEAAVGCSLTEAAHAAGFADAAHFTRTMRRHFGITPRSALQALRGDRAAAAGGRARVP